jgi:antitoxin HicB
MAAPPTLEEFLARPYQVEVSWDETYWAARFPELPGLGADGGTLEELAASIDTMKRLWYQGMIKHGKTIPEPDAKEGQYKGRLLVRVPKSLHRQVARAAERDDVSINQFILTAIAKEIGRREGLESDETPALAQR